LALLACGPSSDPAPATGPDAPRPIATAAPERAVAAEEAQTEDDPFVLVMLGDSLSAGDGLAADASLPAQVDAVLHAARLNVELRDASVSGLTTARARAVLAAADGLAGADGLVIQLGLADMLAGGPPDAISANIGQIINDAQSRGLWVGVIGMRAPIELDTDVRDELDLIYFDLAAVYDVPLYPYYFDGLIDSELGIARPELFLPGGIYPNEAGVATVAQGVGSWLIDELP
jgi:acyl-CoA thioesterase-1